MVVLDYVQYPTCSKKPYSILWQLNWSFCLKATSYMSLSLNVYDFPSARKPDPIHSEANRKSTNEDVMHLLCKHFTQNTCYSRSTMYQLAIRGTLRDVGKKAVFLTRIHHSAIAWQFILLPSSWNSEARSVLRRLGVHRAIKIAFRTCGLREGLK